MDETVCPTHGAELGDCFAQSFVEDGLAELLGVPAERLGRPAPATLVDRAALDGFRGGRGKGNTARRVRPPSPPCGRRYGRGRPGWRGKPRARALPTMHR
jgi:hypothetical protein